MTENITSLLFADSGPYLKNTFNHYLRPVGDGLTTSTVVLFIILDWKFVLKNTATIMDSLEAGLKEEICHYGFTTRHRVVLS